MYDIFFLSFNEPEADKNYLYCHQRWPRIKRVDNIVGILNAHKQCALQAKTSMFYVIDADNRPTNFDFSYDVPNYDKKYLHLWYAKNPVNDLEYGWGGIKLFPKTLLLEETNMSLDMTTNFELKIIPEVASITRFNKSPFDAWRSAFRECVKLVQIDNEENSQRLDIWCNYANGENAEYVLQGAKDGRDFGLNNKDELLKINDFKWLKEKFDAYQHRKI